MKNPTPEIVKDRPAETAGPVVMAVAMLIGIALELETATIGLVAIVVAFVPAAVTWLVELVRG